MLGFLRSRRIVKQPRLPEGIRVYAFGDIHGRSDLLKKMFTVIDADMARNPVEPVRSRFFWATTSTADPIPPIPSIFSLSEVFTARRCSSRVTTRPISWRCFAIPAKLDEWRQFGGLQTLMSYGIQPSLNPDAAEQTDLISALIEVMPDDHLRFLENLKPSFVCGDFFFVHAGVRPGIPLKEQQEADLLWIRNEFLDSEENFGKFIVHGHTPVREPDIRPNRINIDTGAYATGNLTLLTIQGSSMLAALSGPVHDLAAISRRAEFAD